MARSLFIIMLLSGLLVLLGITALAGWILHEPALVHLFHEDLGMSPAAGGGFMLVGLALTLAALLVRRRNVEVECRKGRYHCFLMRLLELCALLLVLLGGMALVEWLAGISLGLSPDPAITRKWLVDGISYPGKMRPLTAIGFIALGWGAYLLPRTSSKWALLLTPLLTIFVIFIGLLGFIGQLIGIGLIMPTIVGPAFTSGLGFVLSGGGLLLLQYSLRPYQDSWYRDESDRITLVATFIVVATGIMGISGGFGALYQQMVEELENNLEISLQNRRKVLEDGVQEALRDSYYFSERTTRYLEPPQRAGAEAPAIVVLQKRLRHAVGLYREFAFSGARFRNLDGQVIAAEGVIMADSEFMLTLNTPVPSTLMWHDGFVIRMFIPIVVNGVLIGTLEAERRFTVENDRQDISHFGNSLDFPVCAPQGPLLQCFPFRSAGWQAVRDLPLTVHGEPISLSYGLKGISGIAHGIDYRGIQVIAAFGPVANLGLIANLEVDATEFYQRITQRLWPMLLLLLLITAAAIFLLRLQVVPLVRRMTSEIDERSKAESNLQESEAKLAEIAATLGEGVYVFDEHGIITFVNPEAERILGWSPADLLGRCYLEILHCCTSDGNADPMQRCPMDMVMRSGQSYKSSDKLFTHKNGTLIPVAVTANPIIRDGIVKGCVTSFEDITQKKQAEAELRKYRDHLELLVEERTNELHKLNRELEAFSYSVSHDLRSPLRTIRGFNRALQEDFGQLLPAEGQRYLERMNGAAARMNELIDGLLNLSHVIRKELMYTRVNMSDIATAITASLKESEPQRNVSFTIEEGLVVTADARLMHVLLENLLDNAWKFTSGRTVGQIELASQEQEGGRVFYVRDNGQGFDMSSAEKLFQPFQRYHDQDAFPGNGIGLATVQRIVERHGGRVWAVSNVEKGTTIYFTLPAATE